MKAQELGSLLPMWEDRPRVADLVTLVEGNTLNPVDDAGF